jgi:hypothetical protein
MKQRVLCLLGFICVVLGMSTIKCSRPHHRSAEADIPFTFDAGGAKLPLGLFNPSCRLRINSDNAQRSEVIRMVWGPRHCRHRADDGTTGFSTTSAASCGGVPRRGDVLAWRWPVDPRWPPPRLSGYVCGDSERSSAKRLLHSKGRPRSDM